jgi:methylamine methyltransferase corrinoid activation protein
VVPGAERIIQFGNTSIELARRIALDEVNLYSLRDFAKKLRATHCMFAMSQTFKDIYSIEYSLWAQGMPASEYNNMLEIYNLPPICEPSKNLKVERTCLTDLPDTDRSPVKIVDGSGTILRGLIEGCIACKRCVKACPEKAIQIVSVDGKMFGEVRSDRCAGTACRRCEGACKSMVLHLDGFKVAHT